MKPASFSRNEKELPKQDEGTNSALRQQDTWHWSQVCTCSPWSKTNVYRLQENGDKMMRDYGSVNVEAGSLAF